MDPEMKLGLITHINRFAGARTNLTVRSSEEEDVWTRMSLNLQYNVFITQQMCIYIFSTVLSVVDHKMKNVLLLSEAHESFSNTSG